MGAVLGDIGAMLDRTKLQDHDVVWLFSLDLGGRVYRFSSETVTITDSTGDVHQYEGTLSPPSIETAFAMFTASAPIPTASIEILFPESAARLASNGIHLSAATGELSLWTKTTTLDRRFVLLRGRFLSPQYGDDGEPVSGTLTSNTLEEEGLYPDPSAIINAQTWPVAPNQSVGKAYPLVWGTPGQLPAQVSTGATGGIVQRTSLAGTPAMQGSSTLLVIAGHPVIADKVSIWHGKSSPMTIGMAEVITRTDGLGRVCSVLYLASGWGDSTEWKVGWYHALATTFGGIESKRPDRIGLPLADMGELMQFMFRASTIANDAGRIAAVSDRLRFMKTSGFIDERISPYEWILENIVPLFPITMAASGADGVYPILWNMNAVADDAVIDLVEASGSSGNCYRLGLVTYEEIDLANEITVKYGWDNLTDSFAGSTTLDGNPEEPVKQATFPGWRVMAPNHARNGLAGFTNAAASGWPNAYARFSQLRHGKRAMAIDAPYVFDTATADFIAQWISRARCTPPRVIQYAIDIKLAWLSAGDVVTINDASISVDSVAYVRSIEWADSSPVIELVLVEDPIRDSNNAP